MQVQIYLVCSFTCCNPNHVEVLSWTAYAQPAIYPNYFDKQIDLDNAVNAIKQQALLANTTAFQGVNAQLYQIQLKECAQYTYV